MVDPAVISKQSARGSWLKTAGRVVAAILLLAVVLAAGVVVWFRSAVSAAMPTLDGTVKVVGLKVPVSVVRDAHGVPTITAQNTDDLFFAQGYVTAQDRLWQMDMMRRYAAGELAAALGADYVQVDREQRVLGLREVARRSLEQAPPEVREQLDAYARGVNAYIQEHQYGLPLEMRVIRYFPRAWTAEDSVLVGASMAEMLTHGTYLDDLHREKILARLGPELTADLYVESSQRDIAPGHDLDEIEPAAAAPDTAQKAAKEAPATKRSERRRRHRAAMENPLPGNRPEPVETADARRSNYPTQAKGRLEWATHPTERGLEWGTRPNEDTREWGTLERGWDGLKREWETVEELPGAIATMMKPAIPDGMDRTRAGSNNWVISGAHTESGRPLLSNDMHLPHHIPNTWYEAHLTCGDYDVAGVTLPGAPWVIVGHNRRIAWGFTNLGADVEDVYVENFNAQGEYQTPEGWRKPEVRHEVIHVKRGRDVEMDVLVTRHGPIVSGEMKGENRQLALKWALFDTGLSLPFFAVNNAQNWDQFRTAFAAFNGPGQNVVYADVDGNIGYQATGRVPIRAVGDDGTLPVSGADNTHEWTGYVPFEEMPSVYNPPSGIIATANGRITAEGYKYSITKEWESPYRTERIYRVLRQDKKFNEGDMLALQTDVQSDLDKFVAQRMVYAVDQTPGASARARQAADILRRFDGKLSMDSSGAAIEQQARRWLMETLLKSKLGDDAELYTWYMKTVWLENVVAFQPDRWLPGEYKSWDALLTAAMEAAANDPKAPADLTKWNYGDYEKVEVEHPIFGKLPWLKRFAGTGSWPQSGNGITVKQVGKFAPSERFTADFAELDNSTLNIVNGESGNLFSPYFDDQFEAWYRGTTFGLAFAPDTVTKTAVHRLELVGE
jgi:penicillin G amidase